MQTREATSLVPDTAAPPAPSVAEVPALPVLQPVLQDRRLLRLVLPPGVPKTTIATLQQAPILVQHARNRGVVRRLDSVYYDSADYRLFGSLMSLRVQRHGRRFIQTLRQIGPRQQALPDQIWQSPVEDILPDLSRLVGIEALAPLLERLSAAPLVTMFETRLRRQVRRLELPTAIVDIAFDEGLIEAGGREQGLTEISLSLQSGEAGVLYDIAMRLLELGPLQIDGASVARRGYALASGVARKAEKAAPSTLTPAFGVDDMIAAVLGGCQAHLQANQSVAEEGSSPDGVHQMRVALRRMRSAFSLLRRELPSAMMQSLGDEAKWAAGELGQARGWDVFLMTTLTQPARLEQAGADFQGLREACSGPRAAGYATARAMIEAARYSRFQLSLSQWIARRGWRNEVDRDGLGVLAEPASAMATRVLGRLQRRAFRQGAHFRRLSATERHELRITLKKLRYATEFFLPLFAEPAHAHRYVRRLSSLQEALGLDHDAATTQPLLDELGQLNRSPGVHQAIGVVIGWQARDGLVAVEMLAERWQRFKSLPPFWIGAKASAA